MLNDKQVIITGPTSGIGLESARGLAALGANLVLACRDIKRGQELAEKLTHATKDQHIAVMHLEASSQASIREFARAYEKRYPRLDVLVNNAALNRQTRQLSADGVEMTFATNVLGYYLLTVELLDLLKKSAPARIVNVASEFASNLDLDDLQFERRPYDSTQGYAQSKACDRLLTWAFARRLAGSGVTANALAPGLVPETGLYREMPRHIHQMLKQRSDRTSVEGADTVVWLASAPEVAGVSGKFYEDREEVECEFRNDAAEDKLWQICEKLTGGNSG
ncbi:MAG: SDR family NAD(P)-dependent oxidoreductase [Anaerolineae bacterium]